MRRWRLGVVGVVGLVILLLAALHMMSGAVQNSERLSRWFIPLLVFTVSGLVTLVGLIGANLFRLWRENRRRASGSGLTARLVVIFVLLSLAPVSVVYFYSLQFLLRGIDSWFDVQIDTAMEDALSLSRASLDLHKREMLRTTQKMLGELEDSSRAALTLSIGDQRNSSGATELALFDLAGTVIASSNVDTGVLVPETPENPILQQVRAGESYVGMHKSAGQLYVRCLVRDLRNPGLILQALYPVADTISNLSESVQDAYVRYKERIYLRNSIKFSFALTLSLVLMLGLFAAVWAAFQSARRLVAPIRAIADGTLAVGEGNYDKQLPVPRHNDELSFLVASFNAMTRRIAQARNIADRSRRELQAQHAYLETLLSGLSSGVIALDDEGSIRTANPAALEILGVDTGEVQHLPLERLIDFNPQLEPFVERVRYGMDQPGEWRDEITLYHSDGRQVLLSRRSPIELAEGGRGHVLVFDDVTALVKAQRDAAWGEVARRLAHEIKNPLTPIQLSAERLRHKYLDQLPGEDAALLDRATNTIVQQVEAMKAMVNAFSDYAKPSKMEREPVQLDPFIAEVLSLYEGQSTPVGFRSGAGDLQVEADPVRLRQVLHNLIKNAQEAVSGQSDGRVEVRSAEVSDGDLPYGEIQISDNGPGFSSEDLGRVFEPYVTTKAKGTGLGLAIVKKIVEEHGGMIRAGNDEDGGGCVVLRLPRSKPGLPNVSPQPKARKRA